MGADELVAHDEIYLGSFGLGQGGEGVEVAVEPLAEGLCAVEPPGG